MPVHAFLWSLLKMSTLFVNEFDYCVCDLLSQSIFEFDADRMCWMCFDVLSYFRYILPASWRYQNSSPFQLPSWAPRGSALQSSSTMTVFGQASCPSVRPVLFSPVVHHVLTLDLSSYADNHRVQADRAIMAPPDLPQPTSLFASQSHWSVKSLRRESLKQSCLSTILARLT